MQKLVQMVVAFLLITISCSPNSKQLSTHSQPQSNLDMAKELADIEASCDPQIAWHLNAKLANIYKSRLEAAQGQEQLKWRFKYAEQLLNAGKTDEAIAQFKTAIRDFEAIGIALTPQTKIAYEMLAIGYMRLGEEENCCARHNEESCFLPIQGKGIHTRRKGSEQAIDLYLKILSHFPGDLQSRYLLNIAYMTLGDYPGKVPDEYLIPDIGKASGKFNQKFRDVAIQTETDIFGLSGGCCIEDFDNDGLLDIMASSYGLGDQMKYLHNNGNGQFEDVSESAGLVGLVSGLNMLQADYNNDGFTDVFVLRGAWLQAAGNHPNSLLRNNGDNTFTDVSRKSGTYSLHPSQTAVWSDFDRDGWIDIFIGNEGGKDLIHHCELFRNNGDGTFTDVAAQAGMDVNQFVKGVSAGDINNDGWPDLYISVLNGPNKLFLNKGALTDGSLLFEDVTETAGVAGPFSASHAGFGTTTRMDGKIYSLQAMIWQVSRTWQGRSQQSFFMANPHRESPRSIKTIGMGHSLKLLNRRDLTNSCLQWEVTSVISTLMDTQTSTSEMVPLTLG